MRSVRGPVAGAMLALSLIVPGHAVAGPCPNEGKALGVSRIVEIDTSNGPLYGDMTKYTKEDTFLKPKEVVLTFDDGPMPWITKSILDTLDTYCTKATFFSVGKMAMAYPASVKDVVARGHTLGTHTWSHPLNIARLNVEKAKDQIERGFAAVSLAAGTPIAPFFRFPGLSDSGALLAHLQSRGVAAFTVDVVSNDSFIASPDKLIQRTLAQVEARQGGIILFHDIKSSTAKALPAILAGLKDRGYTVVQLRAKAPMAPLPELEAELKPALEKVMAAQQKGQALLPFYGSATTMQTPAGDEPEVTELAPEPRTRVSEVTSQRSSRKASAVASDTADGTEPARPIKKRRIQKSEAGPDGTARRKKEAPPQQPFNVFGL